MSGLFITATDTEVGKTVVTAGLLRHLRGRGVNAVAMKPVQTGGIAREDGRLTVPDVDFHLAAAGMSVDDEQLGLIAPHVYEPACSPHLAGRLAGCYPSFEVIDDCFGKLSDRYGFVLVEGAGGVYAPLDESRTMLDLMAALKLQVLLVARRGLGTINHTLLSIEALRNAGLPIFGLVFNETEDVNRDFIREDNPKTVAQFSNVPVLADIDYLGAIDRAEAVDWENFDRGAQALYARIEEEFQL